MYSSALSVTFRSSWGGWLKPCPGRCTPRNDHVFAVKGAWGEPRGMSGWVRKLSPLNGIRSPDLRTRIVTFVCSPINMLWGQSWAGCYQICF